MIEIRNVSKNDFRYQYTDFWYQKPSKMPFSNNPSTNIAGQYWFFPDFCHQVWGKTLWKTLVNNRLFAWGFLPVIITVSEPSTLKAKRDNYEQAFQIVNFHLRFLGNRTRDSELPVDALTDLAKPFMFAMSVWITAMGTSKERKGRGKTEFSTPYKGKGRIFVRTRGWAHKTKKSKTPNPQILMTGEKTLF